MKKSTIIRQSKQYLGQHRWNGVCEALNTWQSKKDKTYKHGKQMLDIQNDISKILGTFSFAHKWLAWEMTKATPNTIYETKQHWEKSNEWLLKQSSKDIQNWRLQWMDQLIKHYISKGE